MHLVFGGMSVLLSTVKHVDGFGPCVVEEFSEGMVVIAKIIWGKEFKIRSFVYILTLLI